MGFVVRAKRVDIFEDVINCSFALDFIDSVTAQSLNGIFKVEGGEVLVGCTEKGRLCVQGGSLDLDWIGVNFTLQFIDSQTRTLHEFEVNTEKLLSAEIGTELEGADDSDVVGIGRVGYMKLRS